MVTEINEQKNVSIINGMYDAFSRGDIASILESVAPDARWVNHLEPIVPWHGDFSGSRVADFFRAISDSVDVLSFEPGERVTNGDTVIWMGTFGCRSKATGKSSTTQWVHVWKLREGKAVSLDQFGQPALTETFRA